MAGENELIIRINGTAKEFIAEIDKVKKKTDELQKVLETTAKNSAIAFAGFTAAIALVTKSFADYEKALVGVGKTTNIEGKKLEAFGKQFQKLSTEIPISTNELLGIAQAAGQLGVSGEANLLKFTETVAKLGVSTDLSGEQAATALTRILNVTGESVENIDKLGSVIVQLGNNFAATESEIVGVATEVSKATAVFGVTSSQAVGLSAALKSLGVQAQLGGSVTGRAFRAIDEAIRAGGQSLNNLSSVTGIAGDQLKKTFETDAVSVFQAFVNGIGQIGKAGGDVTLELARFGLQGDEVLKILPVLAKNSGELGRALSTASDELRNNTALNNEAAKAFATLSSEGQRTLNNFENLKVNIGEQLAPAVTELLKSVNGLLKEISELDKGTLSTIANFLKFGAIISGSILTVAAAGLGFLKLNSIIAGLAVVFKAGRIAALGFTGALTGGLSIVLSFLPEIITGVKSLVGTFSKTEKPKSLIEINKELEKLNVSLEANKKIAEETGKDASQSVAVQQIQARIDKLKELQAEQIKSSQDFGTGELLVRPKADAGQFDPTFGIQSQEIPLAPQQVDSGAEAVKQAEDAKTQALDDATQKRIEIAKRENAALLQIQSEREDGLLKEDVEFLQRKAAIEQEFANARLIVNEQERNLELANLALKHEQELASIEEKENRLDELKATRNEERAALEEELRALEVEQQALFTEEDLLALQTSLDSQQEAEKKFAQDRLNAKIAERNRFKQDEIQFGTQLAQLRQFFNRDEVQGVKDTSSQLAQLANSKNDTLKGIGKAAARVNAGIATAEGAIKAYTALAGIPIIGPGLGIAAAAALTAYGVEQQQRISAMAMGGFVPNGIGGARDRIPTMLEPNELVVPAAVAPNFIQAAGIPDTQATQPAGAAAGGNSVVEIVLQDRAGEFISLEQREGRALGLIRG